MCLILDKVIDEWNSLVERQESLAYRPSPIMNQGNRCHRQHSWLARESLVRPCPSVWREKICQWCFELVDQCDIDRDVIGIALSYFDRYVSYQPSIDETLCQLVAVTSLYLALKLHSPKRITVSGMSALSEGRFRIDQILDMEKSIIITLRWYLNPPTSVQFLNVVNPLIDVIFSDLQDSYEIMEFSRYLIELSLCDGYFINKKPSSIAYASIFVAMDYLSTPEKVKRKFRLYLLEQLPDITKLCAERLRHVYSSLTILTESGEGDNFCWESFSPKTVRTDFKRFEGPTLAQAA